MLWALVMAGGRGTRLWPLANSNTPKPLLRLHPDQETLLEETLKRVFSVVPPERVFIFTNAKDCSKIVRSASGVPKSQIIGEPVSRNTAPTIAIAASIISQRDPKATLLILPADHFIEPVSEFAGTVKRAVRLSLQQASFVIFGAKPTFPSTSYGYLQPGKKLGGFCYELKRFVEKPCCQKAIKLMKQGCLWHAGIFLAPVKVILESFERFHPQILTIAARIEVRAGKLGPEDTFRAFPDISIDYAVLEKLKHACLVESSFKWCDVGTWKSFETLWPRDKAGNAIWGTCATFDSKGNVVYSKDKPVCLFGVDDLVVVDTPHALLVTKKDCAEMVRKAAGSV